MYKGNLLEFSKYIIPRRKKESESEEAERPPWLSRRFRPSDELRRCRGGRRRSRHAYERTCRQSIEIFSYFVENSAHFSFALAPASPPSLKPRMFGPKHTQRASGVVKVINSVSEFFPSLFVPCFKEICSSPHWARDEKCGEVLGRCFMHLKSTINFVALSAPTKGCRATWKKHTHDSTWPA